MRADCRHSIILDVIGLNRLQRIEDDSIVTEGDIAKWFIDSLQMAVQRAATPSTIGDWYVCSQMERYGPDQLHRIPANRRYGVWADVLLDSRKVIFFWDGLEESVSSKSEGDGKSIAEVHCSKFRTIPEFKERIRAAVNAVLEYTIDEL